MLGIDIFCVFISLFNETKVYAHDQYKNEFPK